MHTITVKNIPDELYEKLRETAQKDRRSINSEIIMCLERSLQSRPIDPDQLLARVTDLQNAMNLPHLTDAFLKKAKAAGRP